MVSFCSALQSNTESSQIFWNRTYKYILMWLNLLHGWDYTTLWKHFKIRLLFQSTFLFSLRAEYRSAKGVGKLNNSLYLWSRHYAERMQDRFMLKFILSLITFRHLTVHFFLVFLLFFFFVQKDLGPWIRKQFPRNIFQ